MRLFVIALCLSMAACSGQPPMSPTSPTSAARTTAALPNTDGASQTQAQGAAELPFKGSFTIETSGAATPPILVINGVATGTATHLGQFTAATVDTVDMPTTTSTGTFNLTAANGDQIFTKTAGGEDEFVPPNLSHITLQATIVGGTGRFAGASGALTIREALAIDFASGTSSGSGTFEGHLSLDR